MESTWPTFLQRARQFRLFRDSSLALHVKDFGHQFIGAYPLFEPVAGGYHTEIGRLIGFGDDQHLLLHLLGGAVHAEPYVLLDVMPFIGPVSVSKGFFRSGYAIGSSGV